MNHQELQIAFVGNPNVGKSAWINTLSNANFKVGNWPGVTVEKKEALVEWHGKRCHLIDLPGTYSLAKGTSEEAITARYLHHEHIDLIVNVVDATNLARNLYLTCKLRQLQIPMIVVFNFMDEVEKYHIQLDLSAIQSALQLDIYPYSAFDEQGKRIVQEAILSHIAISCHYPPCICSQDRTEFQRIDAFLKQHLPAYLSMDEGTRQQFAYDLLFQKEEAQVQLRSWDLSLPFSIDARQEDEHIFFYIQELMQYVKDPQERFLRTKTLDAIFLHPRFGPLLMMILLSLLMMLIFQGSAPFNDFIDFLINDMLMKYANALFFFLPEGAKDLLLHGILAGVGGVLVFVPLMCFLYAVLSFLEECGYMSRIAFLMDHAMQNFHLNGKSFVSLLLGFGCNVPAIYATRTLDNEKQKKQTALLVPFMSCGARLPVYMIFAAAFFKGKAAILILSIYGIGILIALLVALSCSHLRHFRDESIQVLELPPYRLPSLSVMYKKVKEEVKGYVHKATSVVLWAMVVLWGLTYFPGNQLEQSYLAQFGQFAAPIYEPLGFGTRWESVAALPGSIIAKETVVGFLDQVLLHEEREQIEPISPWEDVQEVAYEFGATCKKFILSFVPHPMVQEQNDTLIGAIGNLWQDPLAKLRAYSYMVYLLLSIPCMMSLQALWREYGWKLCCSSILLMMILPYLVCFLLFQGFSLLL